MLALEKEHPHEEAEIADTLREERASWWLDGIIGGLLGSLLMGMVAMILFPIFGVGSFWQPMNLIAAVFNEPWGTDPGFGIDSIVGLVVHMMISGWSDRPVPGPLVEQSTEHRWPVEAREAQPVDGASAAHQSRRTAVGQQRVIGDRLVAHRGRSVFSVAAGTTAAR